MGVLCDYFLAADDEAAAATVEWVGGPSQPPKSRGILRRSARPPHPVVPMDGIEPSVMMATLEHLLTGDPEDDLIDANANGVVAERPDDSGFVMRLSDGLYAGLAQSDDARLRGVALAWSETEEFFGRADPAVLADRLTELAALARRGRESGERLYCWVSL